MLQLHCNLATHQHSRSCLQMLSTDCTFVAGCGQEHSTNSVLALCSLQVESSPSGVSTGAPGALLVGRDQIAALNSSILAKGHAKLDLLKQMKEFKRGIYTLEWETRKSDMEVMLQLGMIVPVAIVEQVDGTAT